MTLTRRKCFISYHHADEDEVTKFVSRFSGRAGTFIVRGLGAGMSDDIVNSTNTDYVMSQIRRRYLQDSTVTLVMLGKCTWARRYVDWEIQSSLRRGDKTIPNGLLGIKLPGFYSFPNRFNLNLSNNFPEKDCFARHMTVPAKEIDLSMAIEAAYNRRFTHSHLISNPRDKMRYNRQC